MGVTGYRVFRDGTQVGTPTAPTFSFTGLTCGTTYTLGVAAVDAAGNVSGIATANVAAAACTDATPPSTPTGLATSAVAATSATLSWTASTDNIAVTGYRLYQNGNQVGTSATTSYGYTGLTCETSYTLGVAAVDAAGNVSGTATKSVTTRRLPRHPSAVHPDGARDERGRRDLRDARRGPPPPTTSPSPATSSSRAARRSGTSPTTSYGYTGLTCGTTYTLGVVAVDAAGNVSGTATKSVTTTACADTTPPSTPTGLATSAVAATSATLSWTASTDNVGVTGYRLFQGGIAGRNLRHHQLRLHRPHLRDDLHARRRRGRRRRQRLRHRHHEPHHGSLPGHHPTLDPDGPRHERGRPDVRRALVDAVDRQRRRDRLPRVP